MTNMVGAWFSTEEQKILTLFSHDEAVVMQFLSPLATQIIAAAKALGKETITEGLQVLLGAAQVAAAAGATAELTGQDPIKAAETSFLETTSAQGITVLRNAEAGAIKAAVAIAQTVAQAQVVAPAEAPIVQPDTGTSDA